MTLKGVQFETKAETGVVIDLRRVQGAWEDFYDAALARTRRREPREPLAAVKRRLRKNGKLRLMSQYDSLT